MSMEVFQKTDRLKTVIEKKGSMLVAYSGGADSALLAYLARKFLREESRCVLLDSPLIPRGEVEQARRTAEALGLILDVIPAPLMESGVFLHNPADRCYHCKKTSSKILKERAGQLGLSCVADGLNVSDTAEHRPGIRASDEDGIIHPFILAGITKEDIRQIARACGLPFWDKPSAACLASRIPYGEAITKEKLSMIERAEEYLHRCGVRQVRVRYRASVAGIEADAEGMATVFAKKDEVVKELRTIGFTHVTLDLAGYRSGSMDGMA